MSLKNKRGDEVNVPQNPHYTRTVSLELAEDRGICVYVYDENGNSQAKRGVVIDSFYEKFENENGKTFTIVMSPSGKDAPQLRSDDGEEGWIYKIIQNGPNGEPTQILYDETENIYPSPKHPQSKLELVDKLQEGRVVTIETGTEKRITGIVTERSERESPTQILIDNGVTTYSVHYSGIKLQRWDDGKVIGDIVNVTVEYHP